MTTQTETLHIAEITDPGTGEITRLVDASEEGLDRQLEEMTDEPVALR